MESTVVSVSEPPSSSSSPWNVAICVAETEPVPNGWVGGASCTVAFGNATVAPGSGVSGLVAVAGAIIGLVAGARPGIAPAVLSGTVGALVGAVLSLMVGAAAGRAIGPAVLSGIVGAGAGGAPGAVGLGMEAPGAVATGGRTMPTVGVGGFGATGAVGGAEGGATGAVGGATGVIEADGVAGTSLAFKVTRTVSFFKGMLEVSLDGLFRSSLMGLMVCEIEETKKCL
jgi:hypothetical protein